LGLGKYLAKRVLMLIPVVLVLSFVIFLMIEAIPGDPAQIMLGQRASPEALQELRHNMGLDEPWYIRYGLFLQRLSRGDLGKSIMSGRPVASELKEKMAATIELSVFAILIAILVGVLAGFISAWRKYSIFDYISMLGALVGVSMPIYWLGFMMIIFFSLNLGWLPTSGRLEATTALTAITNFYLIDTVIQGDWTAFKDVIIHLILPAITLATVPMAIIARMTRSSMLESLNQDYVRTAKAKGLGTSRILFIHAFKNAAIPIVTVVGLQFGYLMGGAILTETVFSWPGVGRWILEGIMARDFPVIAGGTLAVATLFILVNLLVDLLYAFLDPRIRY
jgi:peptide/nickel transport system permease protein